MKNIHKLFLGIAIIGVFYMIADATLSNNRVQSRADKIVGEGFTRSLQMSDAEVSARQARSRYAEYTNLYKGACKGMDFENLVTKSSKKLTPAENACLKQIQDSPVSLKKVIRKWSVEEVTPKPITITYNPRKHGVGGMKIDLSTLSDRPLTLQKCVGKYTQEWDKGFTTDVGCIGFNHPGSLRHLTRLMPKEDTSIYGALLVDINPKNVATINVNIPQKYEEYELITGEFTLFFN